MKQSADGRIRCHRNRSRQPRLGVECSLAVRDGWGYGWAPIRAASGHMVRPRPDKSAAGEIILIRKHTKVKYASTKAPQAKLF